MSELNLLSKSLSDVTLSEAERDYRLIVTLLSGHNAPNKFPSFERFFPQPGKVDRQVDQAMKIAKQLGDI
jgi:hypothetical protein